MKPKVGMLRSDIMRAARVDPEFQKMCEEFCELEARVERITQKLTQEEQDLVWKFFFMSEQMDWKLLGFLSNVLGGWIQDESDSNPPWTQ